MHVCVCTVFVFNHLQVQLISSLISGTIFPTKSDEVSGRSQKGGPGAGAVHCARVHVTVIRYGFDGLDTGFGKCANYSHHPKIGDRISNRYFKVMFKIPKMGHLPNPVTVSLLFRVVNVSLLVIGAFQIECH